MRFVHNPNVQFFRGCENFSLVFLLSVYTFLRATTSTKPRMFVQHRRINKFCSLFSPSRECVQTLEYALKREKCTYIHERDGDCRKSEIFVSQPKNACMQAGIFFVRMMRWIHKLDVQTVFLPCNYVITY